MILLLVEGPSDRKALTALVRKLCSHPVQCRSMKGKGDLFKPDKLEGHISYACRQHSEISKVLACVDSECTPVEQTQSDIAPLESQLQRRFPDLDVKYVVVDHSLEGWLLQDRHAVRRVVGRNSTLPRYGNPENQCRPADLLYQIFRRNNRDLIKPRHCPQLAEEVDVQLISESSETFRYFANVLTT